MMAEYRIGRREFVKAGGAGLLGLLALPLCAAIPGGVTDTVQSIRLYMINVTKARNFSHGTWSNRQHVIVQMTSGDHHGWSEALASKNNPTFDLGAWSGFMKPLVGMKVSDAIAFARKSFIENAWKRDQSELIQLALYDLWGKISGIPVIQSWKLDETRPVPGVYTILENDPGMALKEASIAVQQGLNSHVKFKMFGEEDLDGALVSSLRKFFGRETYLMSDANRGYHKTGMDELVRILKGFHAKGLDAIEDPAELSVSQWIALQEGVNPLALIPDYIMRPAPEGLKVFNPAMGKYFNLHPDQMGSMEETALLARKIRDSGCGLMIGDSSFIGPSCTIWQQIAIGAGASWVEAVEKPQESDVFLKCITRMATQRAASGMISLSDRLPGFGLEVDDKKLKDSCSSWCVLE